jgi:hypothetical protein
MHCSWCVLDCGEAQSLPDKKRGQYRKAGRPSRAKVLEEFIIYAQSHPGVAFMRKDEIARFALEGPLTMREGI